MCERCSLCDVQRTTEPSVTTLAASAHCATPDTCPGPAVRNNGQTLVTSADYYESTAFTSGVLSKEPVPGSSKSTGKLQRGIVCDALAATKSSNNWTGATDVGEGRVMDRSVVTLLLLTLMTVVTSEQQQIGEGGRLGTWSKKLYLFRVGFWH